MALVTSPRKVVPLASGEDWQERLSKPTPPTVIRRVFYCGVVVEGGGKGIEYSEEVQDLVASLGEAIDPNDPYDPFFPELNSSYEPEPTPGEQPGKPRKLDVNALTSVITELLTTERSYVHRLRILKNEYADPLRKFSKSKDTAIIDPYDAKTLFGNIDALLPVSEAFLYDLELMMTIDGPELVGGVGDVCLKHFRDLRGFDNYKQYYAKREEAQAIFEREMSRKGSGFVAYVDRIKYAAADVKNRIGLRELLMDPVQRIPRYTLMFRTMIKNMAPGDPQRDALIAADEIASKIALAEMDEQTKRAAVFHCLCTTVEDFPPALYSNARRFISCIDVEDVPQEGFPSAGSGTAVGSLHASLFLFDDKLVVMKRPGNGEKSGRALSGLDELEKMTKSGGLPKGMKRSGMVCKGVVDIAEVVAADAGGSDIHIYLENPPQDDSERWSGRPFRALTVVHPPSPAGLVPTKTEVTKRGFLEQLWHAQALFRTKNGQSVVLRQDEREVESRGGRITLARTYFNVYQRTAFLKEPKKTKVVLHIDESGSADPVPFGSAGPPYVVIRVRPMAGDLCRYLVTSNDPNDEGEEDIVQTARVPGRVVQTIHQFGLFKFRTGNLSAPATPSATSRSRAAIFGLDAISRNLFSGKPGSRPDIFGGSISGSRRSKSATSRNSSYTPSSGEGSVARFSSHSRSTAATSVSGHSLEDDRVMAPQGSTNSKRRSISQGKHLIRRKSPGYISEPERERPTSRLSQSYSRSSSRDSDRSDNDDVSRQGVRGQDGTHDDGHLTARLELARENSRQQVEPARPAAHQRAYSEPPDESFYEEEPPPSFGPPLMASRNNSTFNANTPRATSPFEGGDFRPERSRAGSVNERRPMGPRAPSPMPPMTPDRANAPLPATPLDHFVEPEDLEPMKPLVQHPSEVITVATPIPRSKRIPFEPMMNGVDATPRPPKTSSATQPLTIQKKNSIKPSNQQYSARKPVTDSPLSKVRPMENTSVSARARSPTLARAPNPAISTLGDNCSDHVNELVELSEISRNEVNSVLESVRRLRQELEQLQTAAHQDLPDGSQSPTVRPLSSRLPVPNAYKPLPTREAQDRWREMRGMIAQRMDRETIAHVRQSSMPESAPPRGRSPTLSSGATSLRPVIDLATEAEKKLTEVAVTNNTMVDVVQDLQADDQKRAQLYSQELKSSQRQCDLLKNLLSETTAEKEAMYDAFNEELDAMYAEAVQPEDEAKMAMATDLREAKAQVHRLELDNSEMQKRIAELESQQEFWGQILRDHGLIH